MENLARAPSQVKRSRWFKLLILVQMTGAFPMTRPKCQSTTRQRALATQTKTGQSSATRQRASTATLCGNAMALVKLKTVIPSYPKALDFKLMASLPLPQRAFGPRPPIPAAKSPSRAAGVGLDFLPRQLL